MQNDSEIDGHRRVIRMERNICGLLCNLCNDKRFGSIIIGKSVLFVVQELYRRNLTFPYKFGFISRDHHLVNSSNIFFFYLLVTGHDCHQFHSLTLL